MANTFEEFLKQTPTAGTSTASIAVPGSFQEFLNKGAGAKPPESQKPFFEREGLIQTILKPVINLGKDIAQFTPQYQEMAKSVQQSQNLIAEKLKSANIDDRTKQIIANINDNQEPFKELLNPRTPEQILGDVAGTALLVATPASLLRGIGTGIAAQAARGAISGGLIGGAMGLSEKGTPTEVLKSTAIGAGLGAVAEPLIGVAGQAVVKGVKKAAEVIKPYISKFSETEAMKVISSVGTRLQNFGDDGREIVQRMLNADRNRLQRTGQFMNEAEQSGLFNLSRENRWSGKNSLLDRLEGRAVNESDEIGKAFEIADKARTEIAIEAQAKGVQVRYRGVKPFQTPKTAQISPKIAPDLQPLAQEARKYKSAEEFVKNDLLAEQSGRVLPRSDVIGKVEYSGREFVKPHSLEPYGKYVYHDTSEASAGGILQDLSSAKPRVPETIALSNTPELALGQAGKGVKIIFDSKDVVGVQNIRQKPSAGFIHSQGKTDELIGKEFGDNAFIGIEVPSNFEFKLAGRAAEGGGITVGAAKRLGIDMEHPIDLGNGRKVYIKSQLTDFYNQAVGKVETPIQKIVRGGTTKPFQPKENYFPHIGVSADDIADNTQIFKDAVENAVRLGRFADEKEALQVANAYREFVETNGRGGQFWTKWLVKDGQTSIGKLSEQETKLLSVLEKRIPPPKGLEYPQEMITKLRNALDEAQGMTLRYFKQSRLPKFGQLEYAREVDFPFYDPDPIRVLPKYVAGATKRLEEITSFGVKGEELNKLIGRIRRVQGPEAGFEVADLVKVMTDTVKALPKVEKAAAFVRILSVPKLAFSQIVNIGQSVNSLLASDIPSFAKGFSLAFKEAGVQNALKSGSTLESVINEITTRAGESDFSRKFLKYTGFSATEKFNRTVSANVGMNWAAKNFSKILANPADKVAIGRLEELGVNVSKALQAGKLTEDELLKAAQIFTERTQFRARPIDLPRFASSAYGKIFFQFKSFAYNQTKFLKDEFKRELQSGNYGRAVRDIAIIATIFPMTGEVLGDIKSLATGTKRPTGAFDRYFDDLANVGGGGIAYDLFQSASNNKLSSTLLGPSISSGIDIIQLTLQAAKTGKLTDSQKKTIINQLGITRPIGNYAYSKDTKGYETFFETLKDFLNE
mgnify:CR=1 FL=1